MLDVVRGTWKRGEIGAGVQVAHRLGSLTFSLGMRWEQGAGGRMV